MARVGRPNLITEAVLHKLEEIFALGGTDEEACFYADIATSTLYNYQKAHPEFVERKEALKETPILAARRTVIKSLDDPNHAFRFLERKRRKEFGANVDITSDGEKLSVNVIAFDGDHTSPQLDAGETSASGSQ